MVRLVAVLQNELGALELRETHIVVPLKRGNQYRTQ